MPVSRRRTIERVGKTGRAGELRLRLIAPSITETRFDQLLIKSRVVLLFPFAAESAPGKLRNFLLRPRTDQFHG
jgi:hypothetical protein